MKRALLWAGAFRIPMCLRCGQCAVWEIRQMRQRNFPLLVTFVRSSLSSGHRPDSFEFWRMVLKRPHAMLSCSSDNTFPLLAHFGAQDTFPSLLAGSAAASVRHLPVPSSIKSSVQRLPNRNPQEVGPDNQAHERLPPNQLGVSDREKPSDEPEDSCAGINVDSVWFGFHGFAPPFFPWVVVLIYHFAKTSRTRRATGIIGLHA